MSKNSIARASTILLVIALVAISLPMGAIAQYASTPVIYASAGTGGTISPVGNVSVPQGGGITFTIAPYPGYRVSSVVVNGINKGAIGSYTFSNVTGYNTISASFAQQAQQVQHTFGRHTIYASAGTGGTIYPSGSVSVAQGGTQAFTIQPAFGYAIASVVVDGVGHGAKSNHTFFGVGGTHSIIATFTPYLGANPVPQYIIPVKPTTSGLYQTAIVGGSIKEWASIRSGAGTDFPAVDKVYLGETLELVQWNQSETWCKVLYRGGTKAGWIFGEFIVPQK